MSSSTTIELLWRRYKYRLVVDESLALGVLGATGRGACEHFGLLRDDVEIVSASLGAHLSPALSSASACLRFQLLCPDK